MKFEAGDHVFIGRGPAGAVKHHAIVVTGEDNDGFMEIVEFGVFDRDGNKKVIAGTGLDSAFAGKTFGEVKKSRVQKKSAEGVWQPAREEGKAGSPSRPQQDVVKAALFLLENGKNLLPKYHITFSNGECVARWCQTGEFTSYQADKLYGTVKHVQTVAKMLPVAAVVSSKTKTSTTASTGAKTATGSAQKATVTAAVAGIVTAASAMVDQRHAKVNEEWVKTKQILDSAFAAHVAQPVGNN
jgi:Lecithin retinol acyltransferase